MAITRLTHDGYGMLETNRVDRDNNEAQCAVDKVTFPNGVENGTIVAVDKANGLVKLEGDLKGIVANSERLYDQFHAGLKNYKVGPGEMASVYFLRRGDTFTTNTVGFDGTSEFPGGESEVITALKAAHTTPMYGDIDTETGVIKVTKTQGEAPFTVVKLTTMPDGQLGVKFIVSNIDKL